MAEKAPADWLDRGGGWGGMELGQFTTRFEKFNFHELGTKLALLIPNIPLPSANDSETTGSVCLTPLYRQLRVKGTVHYCYHHHQPLF